MRGQCADRMARRLRTTGRMASLDCATHFTTTSRPTSLFGRDMEGIRAPQGLHVEDKLAFGLSASHLGFLVIGVMAAYTITGSHLPAALRYPAGAIVALAGTALAWGRVAHRP